MYNGQRHLQEAKFMKWIGCASSCNRTKDHQWARQLRRQRSMTEDDRGHGSGEWPCALRWTEVWGGDDGWRRRRCRVQSPVSRCSLEPRGCRRRPEPSLPVARGWSRAEPDRSLRESLEPVEHLMFECPRSKNWTPDCTDGVLQSDCTKFFSLFYGAPMQYMVFIKVSR
jgi:hypothetical protein